MELAAVFLLGMWVGVIFKKRQVESDRDHYRRMTGLCPSCGSDVRR